MPQNTNSSSNSTRYFIQKTYNTRGSKTIKISNNLLTMNANGGLTGNELTSQMKSIQFGSKFNAISPSCFVNCASLLSATLNTKCLEIGDAAFKNCTNLEYVNCLKPATTTIVTQIGNEAFRNTGFESVDIQLSNGGSYGAACGSYAFADCSKLSAVTLERNPYVGEYMFSNCTKLSKFSMANSHSYVGRNAFENCVSLKEIKFPQNFYWLTTEMFKGCTNLSKVTFEETSQLKTVDSDIFSGCNSLTSITLPSSVNKLTYVSDNFLRGSSIKRVVFNGLANEDIATEYNAPQEYKYSTSCIYTNISDIKTIIDECQKNNIPLIGITQYPGNSGCGYCQKLESMMEGSDFKNWLASNTKYMLIQGNYYNDNNRSDWDWVQKWAESNIDDYPQGTHLYAGMFFYWKKSDGTKSTLGRPGSNAYPFDKFKSNIEKTFTGYERNTEISTIINPSITKFGSSLSSITIVSKTGKEFICTQDNTVTYEPEVKIDYDTTNDFRFGIWYYNAKQVKAYADQYHIPVFLEFSSATCEPCKDFKENTFKNKEFQTAIKQKKCLLCRVELEGDERWTIPNTQPYFCVNSWGDSKISIPQTVYYWKKEDGTLIKNAYWYNYRTDPVNSTYQTILSRIDTLTAGYTPGTELDLESPEITTIEDKKSFKYLNEEGDTRGKFFICDKKKQKDSITVNGGITIDGTTENTLTTGGTTAFTSGYTYMWYYPQTDYMYDRKGLIFKVSSEGTIDYIYEFNNDGDNDDSDGNYERPQDAYTTGTIYEMTQNTPDSSLTAIIDQAKFNQTQINIFKIGSSEESNRIKEIVQGDSFKNYAAQKNMLFLNVIDTTDEWSQNAPKWLKQFQTTAQSDQADKTKVFEPTSVHDTVPCLMVYEACSQCMVDGSTLEYKKDNYDLTAKDLTYIQQCIG